MADNGLDFELTPMGQSRAFRLLCLKLDETIRPDGAKFVDLFGYFEIILIFIYKNRFEILNKWLGVIFGSLRAQRRETAKYC